MRGTERQQIIRFNVLNIVCMCKEFAYFIDRDTPTSAVNDTRLFRAISKLQTFVYSSVNDIL